MNLIDDNGGMVAYNPAPPPPEAPPQQPIKKKNVYQSMPEKLPEKNIDRQQITMDSTPISDIMGNNDMMMDGPQDPRMMGPMNPSLMPQAPLVQMQQSQQKAPVATKNPLNLTDKQMEAIVAGVCAIIAFSSPLQDKLSTSFPQFLTAEGSRSTMGLVATGLIAALLFYFIQKFMNKG